MQNTFFPGGMPAASPLLFSFLSLSIRSALFHRAVESGAVFRSGLLFPGRFFVKIGRAALAAEEVVQCFKGRPGRDGAAAAAPDLLQFLPGH